MDKEMLLLMAKERYYKDMLSIMAKEYIGLLDVVMMHLKDGGVISVMDGDEGVEYEVMDTGSCHVIGTKTYAFAKRMLKQIEMYE